MANSANVHASKPTEFEDSTNQTFTSRDDPTFLSQSLNFDIEIRITQILQIKPQYAI